MKRFLRLAVFFGLVCGSIPFGHAESQTFDLQGDGIDVLSVDELNQQVWTISRDEIERSGVADVTQLLVKELGLVPIQSGGYGSVTGVRLRGFSGSRIAVLIDGVPVNSDQSGDFDLSRVEIASLEKVEVIPGGADTKYNINGAVGGVINLITSRSRTDGFRWGASASSLSYYPSNLTNGQPDTQSLEVHGSVVSNERFWNWGLQGHNANNEYTYVDPDGKIRLWAGNRVKDAGLSNSFGWNPGPNQKIVISSSQYVAEKHVSGVIGSSDESAGVQSEIDSRSSFVWSNGNVATPNLSTDLTLSHRLIYIRWDQSDSRTNHLLQTLAAKNAWDWYGPHDLVLHGAMDGDSSFILSDSVGQRWDAHGGIGATFELPISEQVLMVPSLKFVAESASVDVVPVPKIGIVWSATQELTIKHNLFRMFRFPTLNDRYWPSESTAKGNPNLLPEDGWGVDVSVSTSWIPRTKIEVSSFSTWYENAITWQPVGTVWTPVNLGRAFYFGGRINGSWDLKVVKFGFSYDLLQTWVLTDGLTFSDNRQMPYTPNHVGTFDVTWQTVLGTISATIHGESYRFVSVENVTYLPGFFTFDLGWQQPIVSGLQWYCEGKNLLNASYFTTNGYPMPTGSITVGVRWKS